VSENFGEFYFGIAFPTTKSGRQFRSKVELVRKDPHEAVATFYGIGGSDSRAKLNGLNEAKMEAVVRRMPRDWKKKG
jgi:hypothetical protein